MRSLRVVVTVVLAALVLSLVVSAAPARAQDPGATTTTTHDRTLDTTAPLDVDQAPSGGDYDLKKLTGPRHEDSSPGRAAGAPLGVAALVIFVVVGVAVFRSSRSKAKSKSSPKT